jgi:hypothetical protein
LSSILGDYSAALTQIGPAEYLADRREDLLAFVVRYQLGQNVISLAVQPVRNVK